jgi:phospholipid-binding lipoprotein MlaA
MPRLYALLLCAAVSLPLLGGCATNGNPRDPLEPVNRVVYQFNDGVDKLVIKPVATLYRDLLPEFMRTGVGNFFSNINDVIVALNNLLQGKVEAAINDAGRVLVNSTLGVFGVMDPATKLGVEKNNEDFGQTLGYWGLADGPYIVLPFLGPSSVRDTAGWVGDAYTWPVTYLEPTRHRNALIGLRLVVARADLLEASRILETAALDPYEFVRDAYLQRRRNLVYDGNPPDDSGDDGNDKAKPVSRAPDERRSPLVVEAEALLGTTLVFPIDSATADAGVLEDAARPVPTPQPTTAAVPEEPKKPSLVRLWFTPGRN